AATGMYLERRRHMVHRKRLAVDRPPIEAMGRRIVHNEQHFDGLVRRDRWHCLVTETSIVPQQWLRLHPLRLAGAAGVFDHDAHAVIAIVIGEIAKYPNAR